jgi:hypothetical protein
MTRIGRNSFDMSTIAEIQRAIESLPHEEQEALAAWMESRTEPVLTPAEEDLLRARLDEASGQLDSGQGVPLDDVRLMLAQWTTK